MKEKYKELLSLVGMEPGARIWRLLTDRIEEMWSQDPGWVGQAVVPAVRAQLDARWPMRLRVRPWSWSLPGREALATLAFDPVDCYRAAHPRQDASVYPHPVETCRVEAGPLPERMTLARCLIVDEIDDPDSNSEIQALGDGDVWLWSDEAVIHWNSEMEEHSSWKPLSGTVAIAPTSKRIVSFAGDIFIAGEDVPISKMTVEDGLAVRIHGGGQLRWTQKECDDFLCGATFSPDEEHVVYLVDDQEDGYFWFWLWHIETQQIIHRSRIDGIEFEKLECVPNLTLSPDGRDLYLPDNKAVAIVPEGESLIRIVEKSLSGLMKQSLDTNQGLKRALHAGKRTICCAKNGEVFVDDDREHYRIPLYSVFEEERGKPYVVVCDERYVILQYMQYSWLTKHMLVWDLDERCYIACATTRSASCEHLVDYDAHSGTLATTGVFHSVVDGKGVYSSSLEVFRHHWQHASITPSETVREACLDLISRCSDHMLYLFKKYGQKTHYIELYYDPEDPRLIREWLPNPDGASLMKIQAAEKRLEVRLPPFYASFLQVANGWEQYFHTPIRHIWELLSVEEICWGRQAATIRDAPRSLLDAIADGDPFSRRRFEDGLIIGVQRSGNAGPSFVTLDPKTIDPNGEWLIYAFGFDREGRLQVWDYDSFEDFLAATPV
ncbi:MAG: SMI1/KNR4 family protein [Myxococcota bacterium]